MATNDFLAFGVNAGANVISQADYAALASRVNGFSAGTAVSAQLNKAWRQSSVIASVVAQYIADNSGKDVLDNGNPTEVLNNLSLAISNVIKGAGVGWDKVTGKPTTLAGFGIKDAYTATEMDTALAFKANVQSPLFTGIPRADTASLGTNTSQLATCGFVVGTVGAALDALDPWAMQPIGVPIPVMAGAAEPPRDKGYRYIKLTAADPYNTGVLSGEVVTGVAPMVTAYGRVSVAGSPVTGNTIYLINKERRYIRPGAVGSIQDDALQNITGAIRGVIPTAGAVSPEGAINFVPPPGPPQSGITAGGPSGLYDLTFDASRIARTSSETRTKNIGANFYVRVK